LGVEAVAVPFNDLYRKLETGEVDGQENTISNIYTKRLYQVQNHLTLSNHGYLGYAVIVNKAFWDKLPPDIRETIAEAMREATEYNNQLAVSINEKQLEQLKELSSLHIHALTPAEREIWRQAMLPVYDQFAPLIGRELMDKIKQLQQQR
jgi:TRAP-type C4-dicarboxylate transport system substrate-binding protein